MSDCVQSRLQNRFSEDQCFENMYHIFKKSKQIMKDAKVKYLNKCFETNKLNGGRIL